MTFERFIGEMLRGIFLCALLIFSIGVTLGILLPATEVYAASVTKLTFSNPFFQALYFVSLVVAAFPPVVRYTRRLLLAVQPPVPVDGLLRNPALYFIEQHILPRLQRMENAFGQATYGQTILYGFAVFFAVLVTGGLFAKAAIHILTIDQWFKQYSVVAFALMCLLSALIFYNRPGGWDGIDLEMKNCGYLTGAITTLIAAAKFDMIAEAVAQAPPSAYRSPIVFSVAYAAAWFFFTWTWLVRTLGMRWKPDPVPTDPVPQTYVPPQTWLHTIARYLILIATCCAFGCAANLLMMLVEGVAFGFRSALGNVSGAGA